MTEFLVMSISCLVFALTLIVFRGTLIKEHVKSRHISWLSSGSSFWDEDLSKNFWERLILPVLTELRGKLRKIGQRKSKAKGKNRNSETRLEKDLRNAGIPMNPSEFLFLRVSIVILLSVAGIIAASKATNDPSLQFLIFFFALIIGAASPTFILRIRSSNRTLAMQNQLPNVMDILSVSIEAGLGFDAALYKVLERFDGPLIDEFSMVYREIQMGVPRRDALRALSRRVDLAEIQTFSSAIIQAEQYGTPVKNVLRQQAVQLRLLRKQTAQEKGMKAPVRILIPMLIFIFPVIFIVLLGPTIITAIGEFS